MSRKQTPLKRRVAIAAGGGMEHDEIALALGMPVERLEKEFAYELSCGARLVRLQLIEALHAAALAGNVAAVKAYCSPAIQRSHLVVQPPKPEPIGKKAQRNVDARTAQVGTDWEALLPRAVSN